MRAHFGLVALLLGTLSTSGARAEARARTTVTIVVSDAPDALLLEALVRVQAELGAAGFSLELRRDPLPRGDAPPDWNEGDGPALALVRTGANVEIEARASRLESPLHQRIDTTRPGTTAEVVAIRAVESLRAACLQALRDGTLDEGAATETLREFARIAPEDSPARSPAPTSEDGSPGPIELAPSAAPREFRGLLSSMGPTLFGSGPASELLGGVEVGVRYRVGWVSLGVVADGGFIAGDIVTSVGTVGSSHVSVAVRPAVELPCGVHFACSVGVDAGVRFVHFEPAPVDGFSGAPFEHTSGLVQADFEFARYFPSRGLTWADFGISFRGRVGALIDAPVITEAASTTPIGRPAWSVAAALSVRLPGSASR